MSEIYSEVDPNRRVAVEMVDYTRMQRVRIWWRGIVRAITQIPPKRTFGREVIIYKGDPRWDDITTMELVTYQGNIKDNEPDA